MKENAKPVNMPDVKPLIGINFSSRNRPDTLKICLDHTVRLLSPEKYEYVISVVNDLGDPVWDAQYAAVRQNMPEVVWYQSTDRLGVANTKNRGIKILKERGCDHFFLFDDDVFAIKKGWEDLYIEAAARNGIHHLMHLIPMPVGFDIIREEAGIREFSQCCGVLLYFTRQAIDTTGGYRKYFAIYGHEHAELSLRCNSAGLQPGWGAYISPEKTREYIYSLDLELNNWGVHPPDFVVTPEMWRSSILGEDVQAHIDYNAQFFSQREPLYEEI